MRTLLVGGMKATARWTLGALVVWALLLRALDAAALGPGDAAPLFTAPALTGKQPLSLASYRGKVVYLDFWASWCAPCLVSLPLLDELRAEFPAGDFQVLAVNVDRDPEKARAFLARRPVGYPSVSDPHGQLPKSFGLQTMPTSYLIDRDGVIRHVNGGFQKADIDALRRHIGALVAKGRKAK